jgi:TatD DNase family protein
MYREKATAKDPAVVDIPAFINEFFPPECASIVDVHCDPPFQGWKQLAERAGEMPLKYYFSMGCHPHNAKRYNDSVEKIILEAMQHPYLPAPDLKLIPGNVLHGVKWD